MRNELYNKLLNEKEKLENIEQNFDGEMNGVRFFLMNFLQFILKELQIMIMKNYIKKIFYILFLNV